MTISQSVKEKMQRKGSKNAIEQNGENVDIVRSISDSYLTDNLITQKLKYSAYVKCYDGLKTSSVGWRYLKQVDL